MARWTAVVLAAAGCTGKTTPTTSTTDSSTSTTEDTPTSPGDSTAPTTPTPTTTGDSGGACYGYPSYVGTAVPVDPPVGNGPVEDQCLKSEPATIGELCASDPSWTALFGGCPTATQFLGALQPGAYFTTPTLGWAVGYATVFDCTLGADRWTVVEIQSAAFDDGDEIDVFDATGAMYGSAYDATKAAWSYVLCCDGELVTELWVGAVPPAGLGCTKVYEVEVLYGP